MVILFKRFLRSTAGIVAALAVLAATASCKAYVRFDDITDSNLSAGNAPTFDNSVTGNGAVPSGSGQQSQDGSSVDSEPAGSDPDGTTSENGEPQEGQDGQEVQQDPPDSTPGSEVHKHDFKNATCTAGGICECGAVGNPLGHNFSGATCTSPSVCTRCGLTGDPALGHSYSGGRCKRCGDTHGPLSPDEAKWFKNKLTDEQNAEALAVARKIAADAIAAFPDGTDLDRVGAAAAAVSEYYYSGSHLESGIYYSQAYGVFVRGESSCAGCTRALGLVLSVMGYSWTHVNENQWTHQWISLTMDGQEGYADGQVGWVGYGKHPIAD